MWATLIDSSKIGLKVEPDGRFAEITFFGPFDVSLTMTEKTLVECHDLLGKALRDLRNAEEPEQSWMHPATPTA